MSAIRLHLLENPACASEYNKECFQIIGQDRSAFQLSVLEAVLINSCKPILYRPRDFVYHCKYLKTIFQCNHVTIFSIITLLLIFLICFLYSYLISIVTNATLVELRCNVCTYYFTCYQLIRQCEKHVSWFLIKLKLLLLKSS